MNRLFSARPAFAFFGHHKRARQRCGSGPWRALCALVLCAVWASTLLGSACRKKNKGKSPSVSGPQNRFVTVKILRTNKKPVSVRAELALTKRERDVGLMFRGHLDAKGGMLFVFEKPQVLGFWMKNTLIPLDMIFIGQNKKILGIVHNAPPRSLQTRGIGYKRSLYVLEVNGGFCKKHGIHPGNRVQFTLPKSAQKS
jgi:hypothetical protein